MCEEVPSGPGSFRELQNWQQPPPKQTQTMGRGSSGQTLGPARVSPSCVSQTQIDLLWGIPLLPQCTSRATRDRGRAALFC